MFEAYINHLEHIIKNYEQHNYLLAVSGGVDSMVMLALFQKAQLSFHVAHINHQKRGQASDMDETMIIDYCKQHNIPCHTMSLSKCASGNFQEYARNERYRWWQELCVKHDLDYICTAHHKDDSIETFFIHLLRGSGIHGLSGIATTRNNIIRPLNIFDKAVISEYAKAHEVPYREDASNKESHYLRNYIRNDWLPAIYSKVENSAAEIHRSIEHLQSDGQLLNRLVDQSISQASQYKQGRTHINLLAIDKDIALLYQYLRRYGFGYDQLSKIVDAHTGAEIFSASHRLLKNRDEIILDTKRERQDILLEISTIGRYTLVDGRVFKISEQSDKNGMPVAIEWPCVLRNWQAGDHYRPKGMNGKTQKLKDYLTNIKLDKWTKQEVLVLECDNSIRAVVNHRAAHYRSKNVYYISLEDNMPS